VVAFCERPAYIQIEGRPRLADFLVRYVDHDELAVLTGHDIGSMSEAAVYQRSLDGNALSIRRVGLAELATARSGLRTGSGCCPMLSPTRVLSHRCCRRRSCGSFLCLRDYLPSNMSSRPAIRFCAVRRCLACCTAGESGHRSFTQHCGYVQSRHATGRVLIAAA
jgi:hypothetical protein